MLEGEVVNGVILLIDADSKAIGKDQDLPKVRYGCRFAQFVPHP